jgi:hypothetical protein
MRIESAPELYANAALLARLLEATPEPGVAANVIFEK